MSNDGMDELLSIYRCTAREAPPPLVDARILRAADRVATMRRIGHRAVWPLAAAALLLIWVVASGPPHAANLPLTANAGLDAGRTRAELLRMDVMPPPSDLDRFLMSTTPVNSTPDTRNAP
ncbi:MULTISPECIES: hypothetical protein [unclassified Dyella]|uniref:hypothetical protein n=1 Tax=unclassified Dyella TaxID=2634549 RepID=UPI000C839AA8|nr:MULTISPECIES: hypothetical protein [unclassified Dyella]MDR3444211.1 hypothetical protein [Dyella sp.]PMQ06469.1 hypothetical protein DyAD56_05665 [Dyella sp. AD56]